MNPDSKEIPRELRPLAKCQPNVPELIDGP